MKLTKKEARDYFRTKRKQMSATEVEELSEQIFHQLQRIDFSDVDVFHIFLPIKSNNEINTWPIIEWLFSLGKRVVVPIVEGNEMISAEVQSSFPIRIGKFSIPEPEVFSVIDSTQIEVIFLPMFVADLQGNRVGYGGGFYDRFLQSTAENVQKIGLSFFSPVEQITDIHRGDVPLDAMVSSTEILSFGGKSFNVLK
ncbi:MULTISPECIES: 5-formyltetrahydrofolate cyclo-ligase [Weeksella]|uniref:5-formyltetrahydrofolate cyclo-ligase n=1 Tax=Weeksella virosa (strain ATCC 43766 / DSM 16922 / JCM 21250 / CCUG 30538 / CDC 9751 / IAM 14551 / NBRC 16016 / NCTC 11634 / CL345/78) TaxID=865938 RepID=F0P1I5_WEEVC|nr:MULTISPECIES: 5-formyltetrahydrofolate cyclo-ligase [Weeksella]ADX67613.1 5-formyltetrahydrofolate cyclo-ligase [Weeksella virosa DSM 16922]MDK7375382.1 5-formyltetrahydrofolate cyclo-ligase [Weeksella virosa]OFM82972.1 5-formyltetrahydrofolate cyclo-ligase [Weeksella sp. HMSC059D05]SUP53914.1 5-formyltetrahydrofolate cyclo-ligase family protein [Weeksella virosa]VEH64763.1 5-formyltetrahydrofolate cyclo-ligase family protein [Weeksella virosa]